MYTYQHYTYTCIYFNKVNIVIYFTYRRMMWTYGRYKEMLTTGKSYLIINVIIVYIYNLLDMYIRDSCYFDDE